MEETQIDKWRTIDSQIWGRNSKRSDQTGESLSLRVYCSLEIDQQRCVPLKNAKSMEIEGKGVV